MPDEVHAARTGPCGSRRRAGRCGRPARPSRAPPARSRSASSAERPPAAVDEEARAVGGVDHAPAHRVARARARSRARPRPTARPRPPRRSFITGAGLKKCMPTTRSGRGDAGGDLGHAQRRGVRGEHAVVARRCSASAPEQLALELERLGRRLDDDARTPASSSSASAARRSSPAAPALGRSLRRARARAAAAHDPAEPALERVRRPGRGAASARPTPRRAGRCRRPSCRRRATPTTTSGHEGRAR